MASNQIEQREEENPHDIDEVPVKTADFNRREVLGRNLVAPDLGDHPQHDADADDHVQRVHTGHHEVKREENFGVAERDLGVVPLEHASGDEVLVPFVAVLDVLDPQEGAAENDRSDEPPRNRVATSIGLRGPDGQRHGQAAGDQHDGVESAPADAEEVRASGEGFDIFVAIHGVGTEQPPEEQNLLDDKRPHAETGGFVLLLRRLELV